MGEEMTIYDLLDYINQIIRGFGYPNTSKRLEQAIKQLQNGEPITAKLVEDSKDAKPTI